ncbi:sugar kinase [Streptomyces sp. NPDC089424]|uniref:sugar kinase n=1 Tax=Streptomyces sp. NPDC089424 TaxID=3365917 RepID=UPI00381E5025
MTANGPCTAPDVVDVVALGESMVTFLPSRPGRLADVPSFDRGIGGAESNVVCVLAAAGHTTRWVSRVGADGFGDHLVEAVGAYGVDVSAVRRDPARPTGVYFRTAGDRAGDGHEVAYYRAGSAASAMSARNIDMAAVRAARVLHLSGITAALSADCLSLLRELTAPLAGRPLISFDVNHRPGLWRDAGGAGVLLELARRADLVFVGEDEAEEAWGATGGPEAIRELLPEPRTLVVKQGAAGATVFERGPEREGHADAHAAPAPASDAHAAPDSDADPGTDADPVGDGGAAGPGRVGEPAPRVDVVASVGAGDAFAAGFLSATLRGLPTRDRLRHGHLMAAAALTVPGDLATPATRQHADRLAALDDDAWGTLRLGPGWTHAVDRAPEEVRTP